MTSRTTRPRSTLRLVPALVVGATAAVTAVGAAAFASGALDSVLAPPAIAGAGHPQDGLEVAGTTAAPPRAVDGLDAELVRRFEAARAAAAEDGVDLTITSGHRTAQQQQSLVDDALARYGSEAEAHRWVAPVDGSAHVAGTAIDVGPTDGAYWLLEHGAEFGLCQVFANEVWHFEATIEPGGTCGPTVPDASGLWH
ncbi:M15 family metallopeptidase [Cellulomonas fimi]|uniref:M15 family metallopeptidase n=1 Tax=Cellulomonas fimi TaxID=1708 RepID=UPI00234C07A7|nr:M15 family metallopeptidase [Cellulomonas fimi]MDC7121113.1 M15 family metallopeptidase [Cellulomonas fimi]